MENGLQKLPEEDAASIWSCVISILSRTKPPVSNLSVAERRAIKQLRDDDSILILPADKGRSVVVMDKCDYDHIMRLMLEDCHTYKRLRKDPSQHLERKINAVLLEMRRKGSI